MVSSRPWISSTRPLAPRSCSSDRRFIMRSHLAYLLPAALLLATFLITTPARATNGMYLVGYGAETTGRGGAGLQTSVRAGALWRPDPRLSVGAIYQTKTNSTFDNGDMTVNFTDHPLLRRKVDYTAEVDGFTFAAQAGVGFAWRPSSPWVVELDVKRYFWDSAIDTVRVKAKDPSVPGAPSTLELPFVFNWKDQ